MTFTDYLQNTRIENSCRLLIETNDSISEISQRVGYGNTKFFNKIFKSIIKTTPSKFRKSNKRST
jgi:YesN/AraC family two-component response regulator